ncbi:MAG: hypothetical protein AAF253_08640 [Pseudomonadota bacterium]
MTLDHPSDNPAFAAQWTALFAMMEALTVLFRPAGNGECLVLLPWWRRARQALMGVERVFRRLIADIAEAELEAAQSAAPAKTAKAAAPAPASPRPGPAPAPQDAPLASARHPLGRFQLHERPSPARYGGARGPDPLHDPFGVLELSLAGEMRRFARLVVAVSNPAPLIGPCAAFCNDANRRVWMARRGFRSAPTGNRLISTICSRPVLRRQTGPPPGPYTAHPTPASARFRTGKPAQTRSNGTRMACDGTPVSAGPEPCSSQEVPRNPRHCIEMERHVFATARLTHPAARGTFFQSVIAKELAPKQ